MPANLTTKLGQLVDVLTPDTTNTRIGVANASPTRTLDVTGTGAISTSLAIGGATIGTNALAVTGTTALNAAVAINSTGSSSLVLNSTEVTAASRNWGFRTNDAAYGDFSIKQSNAQYGDPLSGTARISISPGGTVTIPGALIISGQLYATAAFGSQLAASKTTNNGASTIFKVPYLSQSYTQYRVRVYCSNNTVQPNYSYQSTEYNIIVSDSSATNVTTISTISSTQYSINGGVLNLTFALTSATAAGFTTFTTTVGITGAAGATGAYTYYQVIPMGSEQTTLPTAL